MIKCKTCGVEKDDSEFHIQRSSKTGKTSSCKLCRNKEWHRYKNNNGGRAFGVRMTKAAAIKKVNEAKRIRDYGIEAEEARLMAISLEESYSRENDLAESGLF